MRQLLVITLAVLVCVLALAPASSQSTITDLLAPRQSSDSNQPDPRTPEAIEQDRAGLAQEIASAEAAVKAASTENQAPPQTLTERLDILRSIDAALIQQRAELDQLAEPSERLADIQAARDSFIAGQIGYETTLLGEDRLREDIRKASNQLDAQRLAAEAATASLSNARENFTNKQSARRLATEQLAAASETEKLSLQTKLQRAQLEERLSKRTLELRRLQREFEQQSLTAIEGEEQLLRDKLASLRPQVVVSQSDRDEFNALIAGDRIRLEAERESVSNDLADSQRSLLWSQRLLESRAPNDPLAAAELERLEAAEETYTKNLALIEDRLARLVGFENAVKRRIDIRMGFIPRTELLSLEDGPKGITQDEIQALRSPLATLDVRITERRDDKAEIQRRIASAHEAGDKAIADTLEPMIKLIDERLATLEASKQSITHEIAFRERLIEDIDTEIGITRFQDTVSSIWSSIKDVWNYDLSKLFAKSDPGESTYPVHRLLLAIILLVFGFIVSRSVSRQLNKMVFGRIRLDIGARAAIQSITFYLLLIILTLIALKIAGIPLTLFTLLGGAIALGIGFGSQKIVNNFISGLILLAERPIRVGDYVEFNGIAGTIEAIGSRSTRLRTPHNIEMIIPNADFLENHIINWTLSDNKVALVIEVGIAYGSDTRHATKLLLRAADEHGKVVKSPPPAVRFTGFGDNTLNFSLIVTIQMLQYSDRFAVPSDLRYRVDTLFREAGIVIAFPQRDVHVDTIKPIDIRMVTDQSQLSAPATPSTEEVTIDPLSIPIEERLSTHKETKT